MFKHTLQLILKKYRVVFKTVDGKYHTSQDFDWANPQGLKCSVQDYILDVNDWFSDNEGVQYYKGNIISMKFYLVAIMDCIVRDHYPYGFGEVFYKEDDEDILEISNITQVLPENWKE